MVNPIYYLPTTFFLYLGVSRFRKMEKTFADLI